MVTAMGGNGKEFGIKVAGLPDQWFTAPAPMMKGRYTSTKYTEKDQLPWIGDSCVVETAGMGGIAAAASPIVCNLRGMTLQDAIAQTREMERICITRNPNLREKLTQKLDSITEKQWQVLPLHVEFQGAHVIHAE